MPKSKKAVPQQQRSKYYPFEFTARECRELAEALETASVHGSVTERRAYRLWLPLDSTAQWEDK